MNDETAFCENFNVSRETLDKLKSYYELLQSWGHVHNLVQRDDLENFWLRHAADSAQLLKYITSSQIPILDLGSGAGFPGLIISILIPNSVFLFESNHKKAIFLEHVIHTLKLANKVIVGRIEETLKDFFKEQTKEALITSRALGSLSYILSLTENVSRETQITYLLHKSKKQLENEILSTMIEWDIEWETFPSLTHIDSVILKITQAKRKR